MKKIVVFGLALLLVLLFCILPSYAIAGVTIRIPFPPPPPFVFREEPNIIVIPDSYVYACPDIEEELFFYDGWWWRHWRNRWYRGREYDGSWEYRERCPGSITRIPPSWRFNYQHHQWGRNYIWEYNRIPHRELHDNWRRWRQERYWQKPEHRQYYRQQERHPQKGDKHRK